MGIASSISCWDEQNLDEVYISLKKIYIACAYKNSFRIFYLIWPCWCLRYL